MRPIASSDGRLLLCAALPVNRKRRRTSRNRLSRSLHTGPGGAVLEGLSELAAATGKSVEQILLAVCPTAVRTARTNRGRAKGGRAETRARVGAVWYGVDKEYHGKVLGRLTEIARTLWSGTRAQVARLGFNIMQPINGENRDRGDVHGLEYHTTGQSRAAPHRSSATTLCGSRRRDALINCFGACRLSSGGRASQYRKRASGACDG